MNPVNSKIISLFINAVQKTGATIEEIKSSPDVLCNSLLKSAAGLRDIVMSEPEFISKNLFKDFQENAVVVMKPTVDQLVLADVGITDAFAGVAQTGSVCITISSNLNSYVSLLPRKHIVILDSKTIVERPRDIFDIYLSKEPAEQKGWIFISGPSATADMGELVHGVHGPDELHIILLVDND